MNTQEPAAGPAPGNLENDLRRMEMEMCDKLLAHLDPFMVPYRQFDEERAHLVLAFFFDPRFSDGVALCKFNNRDREHTKALLQ